MTTETNSSTNSSTPWHSTGYQQAQQKMSEAETTYGPSRVWLRAESKVDLVFVDDEPTCITEYAVKINNDWRNWFTVGQYNEQVLASLLAPKDYKPYFIGFYTVVDCSEWVDKKGIKHQYELKLYPAKVKTLKYFEMRNREKRPLGGQLVSVVRSGEKAAASGDQFEVLRPADMDKLFTLAKYKGKKLSELFATADKDLSKLFNVQVGADGKIMPKLVPFNYATALAPKNEAQIRTALAGVESGAEAETTKGTQTSDIPF